VDEPVDYCAGGLPQRARRERAGAVQGVVRAAAFHATRPWRRRDRLRRVPTARLGDATLLHSGVCSHQHRRSLPCYERRGAHDRKGDRALVPRPIRSVTTPHGWIVANAIVRRDAAEE
jgi:hypothetical protein